MLKKLRAKFIIINMVIVTIMLVLIFSLLFYSVSRGLESENIEGMRAAAMEPANLGRPDLNSEKNRLPYFRVRFDFTGTLLDIDGYLEISDTDTIQELINIADEFGSESGIIKEYNLRFLHIENPKGIIYVFSDISNEQTVLKELATGSIILSLIAFAIFLGISILLAYWTVKPVEKAWKQQKQFIADASHELKTPLTVIMTDADMLHSGCSEQEKDQLSGSILTMSEQMRGLVESLLDLARIDNGSVKGIKEDINFSEAVSDAAMTFEPIFFEKDLPFTYEVDPNIMINGYASHLNQLAKIFLDNAAKYASSGGSTVLTLKKCSPKKCLLEVKDQGEQITDEDLKNLFKRFYRADKARAINHSYGLGLSIAESIANEHKGRIWCESKDGWNSFFVELPIK